MTAPLAIRRAPVAALGAGAAVGILGGLIGLGGAEFRLPLLVAFFRYETRQAITLNLLISLLTVMAGAVARLVAVETQAALASVATIGLPLAVGGSIGAYAASAWLDRVDTATLHRVIRALLFFVGILLIVQSVLAWEAPGLPIGLVGRGVLGVVAGFAIGTVSALLGVAGGELIIPTLVFGFGVPVRAAGTLSLLVSLPTILAGLARRASRARLAEGRDWTALVVPMGLGSVLGAAAGGLLAGHVRTGAIELLLGLALVGSALKIFGAHSAGRWHRLLMGISARNVVKGRIVDVVRGPSITLVKLDVGSGTVITASITSDAIDELQVARGDAAYAVFKASAVMVAKD